MNKDILKALDSRLGGMAESHIEGWGERYFRKSLEAIEYDLRVNHDDSLEIETIEEEVERELTDEEREYVREEFIQEILREFFIE